MQASSLDEISKIIEEATKTGQRIVEVSEQKEEAKNKILSHKAKYDSMYEYRLPNEDYQEALRLVEEAKSTIQLNKALQYIEEKADKKKGRRRYIASYNLLHTDFWDLGEIK
ncbi:hypothetical protein ACVRY7_04645 [Streptococcus ictaluri]|uniref:Uncharacterized protein n=1 Tax=Streptococcus ictaluri 707-05 TaxID=764299 RepID=G5K1H6_9STRE|nr:hypothetical protein [Streptococcus ictaluri]EHI69958.1 hypothetical protein STRIC_2234 [Streptococcus ictaluri 707-05]